MVEFNSKESRRYVTADADWAYTYSRCGIQKFGDTYYLCYEDYNGATVLSTKKFSWAWTWTNLELPAFIAWTLPKMIVDSVGTVSMVGKDYNAESRLYRCVKSGATTSWTTEALQTYSGNRKFTDAFHFVDSANNPHVVAGNAYTSNTYHAWKSAGSWSRWETVSAVTTVSNYSLIGACIDTADNIHILKYEKVTGTVSNLKYTSGVRGAWNSWQTIYRDATVTQYESCDINTNISNSVIIAHAKSNGLDMVTGTSGSWATSSILTGSNDVEQVNMYTLGTVTHVALKNETLGQIQYTNNKTGSFATPIQMSYLNNMEHPNLYVDSNIIAMSATGSDTKTIYGVKRDARDSDLVTNFPETTATVYVLDFIGTVTAVTGTTDYTVSLTTHTLNVGDFIVNQTRRQTAQTINYPSASRASRRLDSVVGNDLHHKYAITSQAKGDIIELHKFIDITQYLLDGTLQVNINLDNNQEASFSLKLPE